MSTFAEPSRPGLVRLAPGVRRWVVVTSQVVGAVALTLGFATDGQATDGKPMVLAVVAVDSLQAIRTQANWVGGLVGSPGVAGMIDAFAPMVLGTEGPGLKAIDETRPLGVVVALVDEQPVLHGFVPAADGAGSELAAMITKAASQFGAAVDANAAGDWVVVRPKGSPVVLADPGSELTRVTNRFSLGLKLYPSRLPEAMRAQLYDAVEENSKTPLVGGTIGGAADIDTDAAGAAVRQFVRQTAAVMVGVTVAPDAEEVVLETHFLANEGTEAAAVWAAATDVIPTVSLPNPNKPDAVIASIQFAQAVTEEHWQTIEAELEAMVSAVSFSGVDGGVVIDDDPNSAELARAVQAAITELIVGIVQPLSKSLLKAVSPTGVIDGCVMVEAVADNPMPKVVLGMRVADGHAFVSEIMPELKKLGLELKPPGEPSDGWQYHDRTMSVGSLTVAVTEEQVFAIFNAGEGETRLEFSENSSENFQPMFALNANIGPALHHPMLGAYDSDLAELGEAAAGLNPQLQILVRPLQGGAAARVALNADCVRFVAGIFLMAGASENVVDNVVE